MYFDFNFDRDSAFFEQSPSFKLMKEKLSEEKRLSQVEPKIMDASLKLWAESVIKHNLDINMTSVEHLNLISEQNSKAVWNTIGKIMFKSKDKRTDEEFRVLRTQGMINNYLQLTTFDLSDKKIDICNNLKQEFLQFHQPKLESNKNPKP